MPSQLFKKVVPESLLFDFLESFCETSNNMLVLSNNSYKKCVFHELLSPFLDSLKQYYHDSKQMYVTRKITYSRFITVIRQLCKLLNISYASKIKYINSSYDIIYYIKKREC
jgi:hypothetical protein